jgi:hypothetical protein
MTVAAAACAAAGFAGATGGDPASLGIAVVAAAVGQALGTRLQAQKVPIALVTLVCALLSAFIASAGLRLGYSEAVSPTLIASVVYIIPGLPLINGFIDLYSYKYAAVGAERMLHAAVLFLLLALAIAFAQTLVLFACVHVESGQLVHDLPGRCARSRSGHGDPPVAQARRYRRRVTTGRQAALRSLA